MCKAQKQLPDMQLKQAEAAALRMPSPMPAFSRSCGNSTVCKCDEAARTTCAYACHNKESALLFQGVRRSTCLHVELPNMKAFKLVLPFAAQPFHAATPCSCSLGLFLMPLPPKPD